MHVIEHLLPEGTQARPTLWHWDVHAPNLFVPKGRVTSLFDKQDTWVGPLCLQAQCPRLVEYNGELVTRLPETYDALEDEDEKQRVRTQVENSIILWTYETETRNTNLVLHDARQVNQARTR
jgi:hypothetical protein